MSTKPSSTPEWSSDTDYPADAAPEASTPTTVEPSSGKKATGWRPQEKPKAQNLNWFQNLTWLWLVYLSDGDFQDPATFDDTVGITGRLSALEKIYCTTGYYGAAGATALFPAGLTTASLHYTVPVERVVQTILSFENGGTNHTQGISQWIFSTSGDSVYYPLDVDVDDQITQWRADLDKLTSGSTTFTGDIVSVDSGGETSATGSPVTNSLNAPGHTIFGASGLTITVAAGKQYYLKLTPGGSITPSADRIYTTSFFRTHP